VTQTTAQRGRERLIFAVDLPSLEEARQVVLQLREDVGMLKVGLELFVGYGSDATRLASENGLELFLDLKLHDIPETVGRAVRQAAGLGARYVTVHASGGRAMLRAAVLAAEGAREASKLEVVAVTVLTSLDAADLAEQGLDRAPSEQVAVLARMAWEEGVRSFVCSPAEAGTLRALLGRDATILTPGVRPTGSELGDQKRVSTPGGAIRAGADRVVVGRPIRDAKDPAAVARSIAAELESALESGNTWHG
jgi:orotidine-5'-phosphate decarboxylase